MAQMTESLESCQEEDWAGDHGLYYFFESEGLPLPF